MFPIAQRYVERVVLVTDDAIRAARSARCGRRCASSPSPAAPRRSPRCSPAVRPAPGERVAVLVCGANTTAVDFDS